MQATSIAPCFLLGAAFLGLGALIATLWPFYRDATDPGRAGKLEPLEGLRAYLALGVFFHHGVITYHWMSTGIWDYPRSAFYQALGPCSVKVFFMITGFLFWTKAIRGDASLPARRLLVGRALRIGPMYLLVSLLVYGTILAEGGFRLQGTSRDLALGLASPLTLGLFQWRPIDGVAPGPLNAEVNWTLQYEWAFYLALPFLARLATPRRFPILVAAALATFPLANSMNVYWSCLDFLAGMVAAHLVRSFGTIRMLSGRLAGAACLGLLSLVTSLPAFGYRTERILLLGSLAFVFLCVVNGNSLFGTLTNRGAKLLGTVGYSLYLLHGFLFYLGRSLLGRALGHEPPSPTTFWAFVAACGALSILVSATTYRFVEHPFIRWARRPSWDLPTFRLRSVPTNRLRPAETSAI